MTAWTRCLTFCVVLLVGLAACARGSDGVILDFFHAIERGDQDAAIALFSPEIQKKFDTSELRAAVQRWAHDMQAHRGLKDVAVQGGVVTYNRLALYDVTLVYGDGTRKILQTSTVHVEGVWYINAAL
jgi:hypothetical protein